MFSFFKKIAFLCIWFFSSACYGDEAITAHKYLDELPEYSIPASARHTLSRAVADDAPEIVYYFSRPEGTTFPIALLCEGSSDLSDIASVIHFHRYFLQECTDLGLAVITFEQWGVDGNKLDKNEWISHYTRSQRLEDHRQVIDNLLLNPPEGWNGKLVFIGVSEGGPIVTALSTEYSDHTVATINWSGAGDWSWREELWVFLQRLVQLNPDCPHDKRLSTCQICLELVGVRENYDALMDFMAKNPDSDEYFLNMTYLYHADALGFSPPRYDMLKKPFLVVTGELDTIINSSDLFVKKAKMHGAPITYHRISNMDHYVRKRPDVLEASFSWLSEQLKSG